MSYARQDRNKVQSLYDRLVSNRFNVWVDFNSLLPGQKWSYQIKKAISNANLFLVCLTNNSIDKRGFIRQEIRIALEYQNNLLDSDIFIVPVRLEKCDIPDQLSEYNGVDLFEEDDFLFLIESIKTIETIQTLSKLNSIDLGENFFLEITDSFQTKEPNIAVGINVIITLKIDDIEGVKSIIAGKKDLKDTMASFISKELAQYFHGADPERCYMRFSFSPKEGENSVENDLENLIIDRVTKEFKIVVVNVIIKPIETELSIRFRNLIQSPSPFKLKFLPLSGSEELYFEGEFVVDALNDDGWFPFVSRRFDLNTVRHHVENYLCSLLSVLPPGLLTYTDIRSLHELTVFIEEKVKQYVASMFGLHMKITYFHRYRTELERKISELNYNREILKLQLLRDKK